MKFKSTGKYVITYTVKDNKKSVKPTDPVEYDEEGRIICKADLSKFGNLDDVYTNYPILVTTGLNSKYNAYDDIINKQEKALIPYMPYS